MIRSLPPPGMQLPTLLSTPPGQSIFSFWKMSGTRGTDPTSNSPSRGIHTEFLLVVTRDFHRGTCGTAAPGGEILVLPITGYPRFLLRSKQSSEVLRSWSFFSDPVRSQRFRRSLQPPTRPFFAFLL